MNKKNPFKSYFYYSIILFLPIYILFNFFPSIVNFNIYQKPNPDFFPIFNNYWSLENTGLESFLLTFFSLLYIILIFYFSNKRLKEGLIKFSKNKLGVFTIFFAVYIFIWTYSNLDTRGFYWQFQKYNFYNLKVWAFCFIYIYLFNASINTKSENRNLFIYILLFTFCSLLPIGFLQQYDLEFFAIPALGLSSGSNFNDIYFQYDLLIPILIYFWNLIGFEIYNFYLFLNFILFFFLIGVYKLLSRLITSRYILSLAIFSIVFFRYYLIDMKFGSTFIQYSPLRADLWLILVLFTSIWGIKSNKIFYTLLIFLILSFNNGVLYLIAFFLSLFVIDILDSKKVNLIICTRWMYKNKFKLLYSLIVYFIVYILIYSYGDNIGTKQFLKYSIQSNKIQKFSIIWMSLLSMGCLAGYIALKFQTIERRKLETYIFLIFLTIMNFTFCFYKNTILSFISVSTSYLILIFIFLDLNSTVFINLIKNFKYHKISKILPIVLILFPLSFNQYGVATILNNQYRFIKSNSGFKAKRINTDINQITDLKKILIGKNQVLFYGPGTYIQYYELSLVPDDYFNFTSNIYNDKKYRVYLKDKINDGFLLIFPKSKVTPWGYPRKEYFDFWYSFLKENPSFSLYVNDKFELIYKNTFHKF